MIHIEERKNKNLWGGTSLYISTEYSNDIINIIKSTDTYIYDKKSNEWEVPITYLSYILDNLIYFDDIELKVLEDKPINFYNKSKLTHKITPLDYQVTGIEYGLNIDKWLLLDAPGLGKTLQLIYLAEELYAKGEIEHCLVICGIASLITNWKKEIEKVSKLSCRILGQRKTKSGKYVIDGISKRVEQLNTKLDEFFIITNVESLRDERLVNAINNGANKFDLILLDEAHKCKGTSSIQSNNLLELTSKYKVAATGTLLLNSPIDLYIPMVWIEKENKKTLTKFKNTFCVVDKDNNFRVIGYKNLELLKNELESCSLRRDKSQIKDMLPERTFIDEHLSMYDDQEELYKCVSEIMKNSTTQADKEKLTIKAKSLCNNIDLNVKDVRALITRLKQITSCPSMLTSSDIKSIKLDRACELVEEITSNNEKVVIFSTYKEPVYKLSEMLKEYNPLIATGDMLDSEVSKNIDDFQTDNSKKVFIATIAKLGTGVTLTAASYMIFIDQPWTEGLYLQCCDRIYRIGSKNTVFVYNLICEDTIDEAISKILERKGALGDYIIDNVTDSDTLKKLERYILDI